MKIPELEKELHKLNIQGAKLGKLLCSEQTFEELILPQDGVCNKSSCKVWKIGDCVLEVCVIDFASELDYGEVLLESLCGSFDRKKIRLLDFQ